MRFNLAQCVKWRGIKWRGIKFNNRNIVSALTGHKTGGSHAFSRYREIDDEMEQEIVDAIDLIINESAGILQV